MTEERKQEIREWAIESFEDSHDPGTTFRELLESWESESPERVVLWGLETEEELNTVIF